MKILKTRFKDLYVIKQINNSDRRGNLRETYNIRFLKKNFIFDQNFNSLNM